MLYQVDLVDEKHRIKSWTEKDAKDVVTGFWYCHDIQEKKGDGRACIRDLCKGDLVNLSNIRSRTCLGGIGLQSFREVV